MPHRIVAAVTLAAALAVPARAQDRPAPDHLAALTACRALAGDAERLACYDRAAGTLADAAEAGEVRLVDREAVRETRRGLFGFALPKIGLFGSDGGDELERRMTSTVTGVRAIGREAYAIQIAEGSVWQVSDAPMRFRPKVGDSIELERAALGSYWVRLNGQNGVKGRRVK